jgi:small subunit ribosomal protein S15
MITKRKKQRIIKESRLHETDTGSAEVQIAVLTRRIDELTAHLKKHTKDNHSRRGLLALVAERRRHLNYLAKKDMKRHEVASNKFKLGKKK